MVWLPPGQSAFGQGAGQSFDISALLKDMEARFSILIQSEVMQCKKSLHKAVHKIDRIEAHSRQKNVIIFGWEETRKNTDKEDMEKTITDFTNTTGLVIRDYDDAFRRGKWKSETARPIMLKFIRLRDKKLFLSGRNKLKRSTVKIENDATQRQKQIRKIFSPVY